jgi:hypothetical protein
VLDEREQRFVIKFLWLQEQGSKAIHAHLRGTVGDCAVSLPTMKRRLRRYILRRQKPSRKILHNLRKRVVEVPLQIFVCFGKKYRESLRYQRIDSEGPLCARAGTP